jgi:ribosomal protein S18 acetylase RimI-like enzyme
MADTRERTTVEVRRAEPADADELSRFFSSLRDVDRSFFKEDVTRADVVAALARDLDNHRLIALADGVIVGYGAVIKGWGWSRHVGELRLAISPEYRHRGIGRLLAQRLVVEAKDLGLEKLVVDVVAGQDRLFEMFHRLGFQQEGRLRAQVRSTAGETRDLLVLSHFVDELAATLES